MVTPAIVPRVKQWDDQSREGVQPVRPGVLANDIALPARGGEILEIIGLDRRRRGPAPGRPRQDVIDGEGPAADATVFAAETCVFRRNRTPVSAEGERSFRRKPNAHFGAEQRDGTGGVGGGSDGEWSVEYVSSVVYLPGRMIASSSAVQPGCCNARGWAFRCEHHPLLGHRWMGSGLVRR